MTTAPPPPTPGGDGGCAVAPRGDRAGTALLAVLVGLAVIVIRRARRDAR